MRAEKLLHFLLVLFIEIRDACVKFKLLRQKHWLAIFLLFFLGCSVALASPPDCSKYISSDDAQFADKYMQLFREGNADQILTLSDPTIRLQLPSVMEEFKKIFTTVEPFERVLYDCRVTYFSPFNSSSKSKVVALSYEWSGRDTWYSANLRWTERNNQRLVDVLHIDPLIAPLEKIHVFTLSDKGILNWIFLIVAIAVVLFIFYSLIQCVRTKIQKRKWLWIIFILVGVGKVSMIWTTGKIYWPGLSSLLSIQLFASDFVRASEYSPVVMSVSVPLGAIVFLIRKKKWKDLNKTEGIVTESKE